MYKLNEKVKNLTPYDPVAGTFKIRLDANESFINPGEAFSQEIKEVVSKVAFNRYPDPTCCELRESYGKAYGIKPELLMAGNGSDEIITVIMGAFLEGGDKVAVLTPDFSMYGFYAETYERQLIKLEKNDDLSIDSEKLIKELQANKPQALIFSNPCSPTSKVLKKEEVRKIVASTNTLIILDEAYMEFSDESLIDDVEDFDNLIILKTCSKAWGLAAIRLGFAISNSVIINALNAVRSPYNVNSITQAVGKVILENPSYIESSKKQILKQVDELYESLFAFENKYIILRANNLKVKVKKVIKPKTNFVFLEFENTKDAKLIYDYLLEKSIIVRILGYHLRITAGNSEENSALCNALGIAG